MVITYEFCILGICISRMGTTYKMYLISDLMETIYFEIEKYE